MPGDPDYGRFGASLPRIRPDETAATYVARCHAAEIRVAELETWLAERPDNFYVQTLPEWKAWVEREPSK